MDRLGSLVVTAPVRRAGDLGSNPGPNENFSLKLLSYIKSYCCFPSHHTVCSEDVNEAAENAGGTRLDGIR